MLKTPTGGAGKTMILGRWLWWFGCVSSVSTLSWQCRRGGEGEDRSTGIGGSCGKELRRLWKKDKLAANVVAALISEWFG